MQPNLESITDLIHRCLQREQRAEYSMYKLLYPQLIGVCWRYANQKDQALDYFNAGFVRIMLNLGKYNSSVPFEFWSRRVMINTIINEFKRNKRWYDRHLLSDDHLMADFDQDGLTEYQSDLLDKVIEKAKLLPPMTKKVFNLYALDGYHHYEIAEQLGISEGTSAWHYSDAKRKIRTWLGVTE